MLKLAIIGIELYDQIIQKLRYLLLTKEIEITHIFSFSPTLFGKIDNVYIQNVEEIKNEVENFDYAILGELNDYKIAFQNLSEYIVPSKIINANLIINYTGFDLIRYIKIVNSRVSIISDSCWGGFVYNSLNLPFLSPLINTRVDPNDFLELISNIDFYFSCPLELYSERDAFNPPIGILGGKVKIGLNHYVDFNTGREEWNRRVQRVNYDNLVIQMANFNNYSQLEHFDKIPIKNKIGFYPEKTKFDSIVYLKQYSENENVRIRSGEFVGYVQSIVKQQSLFFRPIDIFKLLLHEKDFLRIQ